MAVPHVAATAALIVGEKLFGPNPTPAAVESGLEKTARHLGPAGYLNAAAATAPLTPASATP